MCPLECDGLPSLCHSGNVGRLLPNSEKRIMTPSSGPVTKRRAGCRTPKDASAPSAPFLKFLRPNQTRVNILTLKDQL